MSDEPTTLLPSVGQIPPGWFTPADAPVPAPEAGVMRRVLAALRAWGTAPCALCGAEPVTRPDQPRGTIDGRFCAGCIERCLGDTSGRHWCPVDALGEADG